MQFPQSPHPHWAQNGRISTIRFHNLKYLEGNCMRNLSPADERRPQGLRAHIHTFTMRAFSDSSAKKSAHCGPSRSSSAKNSPGTPPPTPHPIQNSPNSPFPTACAGQNSPNSSFPTACAGQNSPNTKHTGPLRYKTRPAHPFTLHARYKTRPARPKWPNMARFNRAWRTFYRCHHQQATQGELFSLAPTPGRAGEFLLRAQPPLRLGILPLTSTPPSWRRPSSAGKINKQPPHSAPTILR